MGMAALESVRYKRVLHARRAREKTERGEITYEKREVYGKWYAGRKQREKRKKANS